MSPETKRKLVFFFVIVVVGVVLDQVTKMYASQRLATTHGSVLRHPIELEVNDSDRNQTLEAFLTDEFWANTAEEVEMIANRFAETPDGRVLEPNSSLENIDTVRVLNRKVTVVDGYWDFEYTENRGAAFGMLSDTDSPWRRPFFVAVSLIAFAVIILILLDVPIQNRLMVWSLSFIGAGAVGNLIDRIASGAVVDFIVWKYTDAYRWPTFNVADSFITVGMCFMAYEFLFGDFQHLEDEADAEAESEPSETGESRPESGQGN